MFATLMIVSSVAGVHKNVTYVLQLFDTLGLTINVHKSVLTPSQEIKFSWYSLELCLYDCHTAYSESRVYKTTG